MTEIENADLSTKLIFALSEKSIPNTPPTLQLDECLQLTKALEKSSATFSGHFGLILPFCIVDLILIFYRLSAFFIGNYQFTTSIILIVTGFGGLALVITSFIVVPAYLSENVADEVQQLGIVLMVG